MGAYKDMCRLRSIKKDIKERNIEIATIRAIQVRVLRDQKINQETAQYLDKKFEEYIEQLEAKKAEFVKERKELEKKYLGC